MALLQQARYWAQAGFEGVKALSPAGITRCAVAGYLIWLVGGAAGLALLVVGNAVYIMHCYRCWQEAFQTRHRRGSTLCPSSTLLPPEAKYSVRSEARRLSEEGELLLSPTDLSALDESKQKADDSATELDSGPANKKVPFRALRQRSHGNSFLAYGRKLQRTPSERLDMDHIKVSIQDYLWAMYFVGPHAVALWCFGIAKLLLRRWLCKRGWITPAAYDAAKVVGDLLLEGVGEATNYVGEKDAEGEGSGGSKVGMFLWPEFAMLTEDGSFKVNKRPLSVEVCLESGRMTRAMLGSRNLSARDALVLVFFDTIGASHVKLHSLANWGVNNEAPRGSDLWRDSVTTVMYNHFGFFGFPRLCRLWHACGVTSSPFDGVQQCFIQGVSQGVSSHKHISQLMHYSRTVSFVTKLRNHFLNDFAVNKVLFPGADGEALFVATVLHSLDHQRTEWNVADPLWLSPDSAEFSAMAELSQIVRVGFVSELPLLSFDRKLSQSSNPFWMSVYAHAMRLDPVLANSIDTCIIR